MPIRRILEALVAVAVFVAGVLLYSEGDAERTTIVLGLGCFLLLAVALGPGPGWRARLARLDDVLRRDAAGVSPDRDRASEPPS